MKCLKVILIQLLFFIVLGEVARYHNGLRRPYLYNSAIEYHTPSTRVQKLASRSYLYYAFHRLYLLVAGRQFGERKIAEQGEQYPLYKESVKITEGLFREVKAIVEPEARLMMFCADYFNPSLETIRQLAQENDILYSETHIHRLHEARDAGKTYVSGDGVHWNELGHQLVAKHLLEDIRKHRGLN